MTPPATVDVQLVEVRPDEGEIVASPIVEIDVVEISTSRGYATINFLPVDIPVTLPAGRNIACVHIAFVLNAPAPGLAKFFALSNNTYTVENMGKVLLNSLTVSGPEIEGVFR
jgi:hypothetical protein